MARRTPLYDRHLALGARMVEFGGFDMPVWYTGLVEEHLRVRSTVGLFDVSHMGEIRVRGRGAAESLSWLVSNEIRDMLPGQARYTLLPNEAGGIVDDLVVYRMADDDFLVCCNASNRAKDFAWMTAHATGDATYTDEGDQWGQIAVQGRAAEATLQPLTDVALAKVAYYHHAPGTVAGVGGCIVARTGYTGEPGFEVFVPLKDGDEAGRVWDALLESGRPHEVAPIGLGARDTLRLEVRFPLYGHELNDDTAPHQARLMWVTKLDKPGGFLGADAIRRRKDEGLDTHFLSGAIVEGKRPIREGCKVLLDGREVGWVTSGTRSPSLGQNICLFYAERGVGEPGARLQFDVKGSVADGTVVKGPFVSTKST
jgi:aminomethyltransferase